jgi:hypothetical protein
MIILQPDSLSLPSKRIVYFEGSQRKPWYVFSSGHTARKARPEGAKKA